MKYLSTLLVLAVCMLVASMTQARPGPRHDLAPTQGFVDVVGDVDGSVQEPTKAAVDTTWIATWNFEGCDETGWVRSDNRILNDGNVYWSVNANYDNLANFVGDAAVLGKHDLCWVLPDGYDNDWYQGICIHYVGESYLSFDWVVDSEAGFDFLQVETDSACASFARVDYDVDPDGNAGSLRDLVWAVTGFDTTTARVDSIALSSYAANDTHCVYIAFFADGVWSPADGLVPSTIQAGAVVDNVLLEGAMPSTEDFSNFTETAWFSFVNMQDSTPFGVWARTFRHISDNDLCTENPTCAWLSTDYTTPTLANDPSMAFGPSGFVIKSWLDEVVVGPWVSLASTASAVATYVQFRRFGGNIYSTSRLAQNWSIRGRDKIDNTDSPVIGDSIDCVPAWGHRSSFNTLGSFEWKTLTWDATPHFDPGSHDVQLRFRLADRQWIAGSGPPNFINVGPGPFWDRVRIGRNILAGPVIDEGIDARYQAQDAAPNDPAHEAGPMYAQATGSDDIFGTVAFSMSNDNLGHQTPNLIVGDSITVKVMDVLGTGGVNVEVHAAIVAGPHAGKSPAPFAVGANGFFVIPADSSRDEGGAFVADHYFVDMDDTYFRGGDVLRYYWWAVDQNAAATSNPAGLTAVPSSLAEAEAATGGLFEVNFLPSINWDAGYLGRIAADAHGDFDPTPTELANSSQRNCILYYQMVNWRRRSGDINRTSFMYTLDKLGYRGSYDVYDVSGMGNTNNQLGARMSPEQARQYSLLIFDAGDESAGTPILPDGSSWDVVKIDMSGWFQSWNALSGTPNPEHTLWIIGSNAVEENRWDPLYASMAVNYSGPTQSQSTNPDVFGNADFTTHTACVQTHVSDLFALNGGCPVIRDYDDVRATGSGVQTHVYGKGNPSAEGAIVMHANPAGYTTILQSFPWFDIAAGKAQSPTQADEILLARVLACALPGPCHGHGTSGIDDDDKDLIATPSRTVLHQNTPNPFNPTTVIRFDLAHDSHVSLHIYDVAGRQVRALTNEKMTVGFNKKVQWNGLDDAGRRVSSGVYFYRLEAQDFRATRKLVVMK